MKIEINGNNCSREYIENQIAIAKQNSKDIVLLFGDNVLQTLQTYKNFTFFTLCEKEGNKPILKCADTIEDMEEFISYVCLLCEEEYDNEDNRKVTCPECNNSFNESEWNEATKSVYGDDIATIEDIVDTDDGAYMCCPSCEIETLFTKEMLV